MHDLISDFDLIDWQHPLADDDLNRNLRGFWIPGACNAWGGLRLHDITGKGIRAEGELVAAPIWHGANPAGGLGSLLFNGTSQYVNFGIAPLFQLKGEITIAAWIRLNGDYTNQGAICADASGTVADFSFVYAFSSGANESRMSLWNSADGPEVYSSTQITDNNWHFVAATRSGSTSAWTIAYYLDGKADGGGAANTFNPSGTGAESFAIGRFGSFNGYYFDGHIGAVWIYKDRVLGPTEIAGLYRSSLCGMQMLRRNTPSIGFVPAGVTGNPYYYRLQQQLCS